MNKKALITGISGQDGSYLAQLLLAKGYAVVGTTRDAGRQNLRNLETLGIKAHVQVVSLNPGDQQQVKAVLDHVRPDEIYHLSAQSSVALSFAEPGLTMESISLSTLNFLEVLRQSKSETRFFNSGSSECFGDTGNVPAAESMAFKPKSPYAIAKAAACWQVANYREAHGLFVANGFLFNHESPLRGPQFVTRKIIAGARHIATRREDRLSLGRLDIMRDWGWAPDYVDAMWRILQQDKPQDFVVATGKSYTLAEFVAAAFAFHGLDWRNHVDFDPGLKRQTDLAVSRANPARAAEVLGWRAAHDMHLVVEKLSLAEAARGADPASAMLPLPPPMR